MATIKAANGKLSQLINKGKCELGQLESKRNKVKALMIDNECAVESQQSFKQRKPLAKEFSFVLFSERNGIGARSRDRPREMISPPKNGKLK